MYLDQPDDTPDLIVHDDFNHEPQPHNDQTPAQSDKDSGGGDPGHHHSHHQQQQAWLAHAGAPPASLDAPPPMGLVPSLPQQLTAGGQAAVSVQGRGPMMMASHAFASGIGALTSLIGGRPSQQQQHYTEQSGGQQHHQPNLLGPGVGKDSATGTVTSGGDMMDVDSQQQPQQGLLLGPPV